MLGLEHQHPKGLGLCTKSSQSAAFFAQSCILCCCFFFLQKEDRWWFFHDPKVDQFCSVASDVFNVFLIPSLLLLSFLPWTSSLFAGLGDTSDLVELVSYSCVSRVMDVLGILVFVFVFVFQLANSTNTKKSSKYLHHPLVYFERWSRRGALGLRYQFHVLVELASWIPGAVARSGDQCDAEPWSACGFPIDTHVEVSRAPPYQLIYLSLL